MVVRSLILCTLVTFFAPLPTLAQSPDATPMASPMASPKAKHHHKHHRHHKKSTSQQCRDAKGKFISCGFTGASPRPHATGTPSGFGTP